MNKVFLKGRIANELSLKKGNNEKNFCPFSLAFISPNNKDKDDNHCFIDCIAFNKTAEYLSSFCSKGTLIIVEGAINVRKFVREDGTKGSKTELIVDHIENLERKEKTPEAPAEENAVAMSDEGLPF